ncbi:LacI family DNA-binding transcriptional regulator [Aggregatilinea lenta]|uniref:LacI family DNA-binding transcriptional regulator n=1 Tax=Aggregatilinea lenta TaxID=913108 RepID=UPI000E5ABCF6|nr:LacI family DNA-binding transcriptional regulator [Aggregatilinea lenta]
MSRSRDKRPTIRDVAREAGVSYGTVSRVLNSHPEVAPGTRVHVQRIMEKMGFERNLGARMLTTHRSNIIEFIVMDVNFGLVLPRMAQYINAAGYSTLYSECTRDNFAETLNTAAARLVDGILLYAPKLRIPDDELLAMCHGIPIVRRDTVLDSKLTWVGYNQEHATHLVVQHLLDLGHRQIAEITGSLEFINPRLRHDTLRDILAVRGLEPGPTYTGDYSAFANAMKTGYEGVGEFLKRDEEFTAIMTVNDYVAAGAISALHEHGLRVPDDVSIASFDDDAIAAYLLPPLTTVYFDFDIQNRLASQFLLEQIDDPDYRHHQHVLIPDLVVRRSTRRLD